MRRTGFQLEEIDYNSHDSAIICVAKKVQLDKSTLSTALTPSDAIQIKAHFRESVLDLAKFWSNQNDRIVNSISELPESSEVAIFGAGFYGAYLYRLAMQSGKNIECFLDSNPHLSGHKINGISIVAPSKIPKSIEYILVGLNPQNAKSIIYSMKIFTENKYSFIFIE